VTATFPPSDFDEWVEPYDRDVTRDSIPFTGYQDTLDTFVQLAEPGAGMNGLDTYPQHLLTGNSASGSNHRVDLPHCFVSFCREKIAWT